MSELLYGTKRFNDLRRGLPRMSPALLSKRLKELESAGIVARTKTSGELDLYEYVLTDAGLALEPILSAMGEWGHRWVTTQASLAHLDVRMLMWNMRRNINPAPLSGGRRVSQISYRDLAPATRNWWLIVQADLDPDLCSVDPGFDIDLYVKTDLSTMTEVWMGCCSAASAISNGRIVLVGDRLLETTFQTWLGASRYAGLPKCVA